MKRITKKEDTLEKINFFRQYLLNNLKNEELRQEIITILDFVKDGSCHVITCTPNSVSIELPDGNTFYFALNGADIETYYSKKSENTFKKTSIRYWNDIIVVSIDESISEIDRLTTLPSRIYRTTEQKIYKKNQLTYQKYFSSDAISSLHNYGCKTESDEIYINKSKYAVKRHIHISNEDSNYPSVKYYRCDNFHSTPFNTADDKCTPLANVLTECDESTFYSFVALFNESPKDQVLRK